MHVRLKREMGERHWRMKHLLGISCGESARSSVLLRRPVARTRLKRYLAQALFASWLLCLDYSHFTIVAAQPLSLHFRQLPSSRKLALLLD